MPESQVKDFALRKIASFKAVTEPMYDLFSDDEEDIFGADGVAVPQVRFPNSPIGSYAEFIDEMVYLASTGKYKKHVLRPRGVSGRIHSMLISRSRRIAASAGVEISYSNGSFSSLYEPPPPAAVLPPPPEDEEREAWEDLLYEAAKILGQDDRDNLFAEMVRLEDNDV